ncbi:hypothetical protein P280DRAFT_286156 [Massarina eburnea CBS 473.64]|uniref:Extracellular membrane protein CFEM domain-containing protein n=1 Tax=Massarina eburnea CBS 473.64 TaxID=1395130 RepID=A0A6A6S536_9PLEO|nr:hypothetical protein P280DRAFT_286156 [Massarina eburnea CBS 473.64]
MHPSWQSSLPCLFTIILTLSAVATASGPTSIFINQVPQYDALSSCAEGPLRTIVRFMSYDCGDDKQTTSYACFCFSSSAKVSSRIDTMVAKACTQEEERGQNASAVEVFDKYCQLGGLTFAAASTTSGPTASSLEPTSKTQTPSYSSSSASVSASPASIPTTDLAASTPSSSSTSTLEPEKQPPVVAISLGVSIPIIVIGLSIVGMLLYRRGQASSQRHGPGELPNVGEISEADSAPEAYQYKPEPVEIAEGVRRVELESTAANGSMGPDKRRVHELANSTKDE